MRPLPLIILAALLVTLLIGLAPFVTIILILHGFVSLIKYYIPSKQARKAAKKEQKEDKPAMMSSSVNTFVLDFLRSK